MSTKQDKPRRDHTHLCGRTKRQHFNRAGLRFEQPWRAIELATLTREQFDAVRGEPEIESRLCTAEEAELLCKVDVPESAPISKRSYSDAIEANAQLTRENVELRKSIDLLQDELRLARAGASSLGRAETILTGAPPSQEQQRNASTSPLPLPTVK